MRASCFTCVLLPLLLAVGIAVHPASGQLLFPLPLLGSPLAKLDPLAQARVTLPGTSRVVVRAVDASSLPLLGPLVAQLGGRVIRILPIIDAHAIEVPNALLGTLSASPLIARISLDRIVAGAMDRTAPTVGAAAIRSQFGYDGAGIGIAVVDSGITSWHDDLAAADGGQRVERFVDFVNGYQPPSDDYGHGTHVAGIIAGDGFDSNGARAGIAPAARLFALKVLDGAGRGRISDVIAALDYIFTQRRALDIRIVNLSIAAGVYESYDTDPLTLAARRLTQHGVVVVAAAGNRGRNANGREAYGGITAPGNAPWVLTVGASTHMGTTDRTDDAMAPFSSRGPAAVDSLAKPDVVAPGVGSASLSDPASAFYSTKAQYLQRGTVANPTHPYLSLSGTSMAAPVVAGTVALMLQANPALTPNGVKAILQFTAHADADYDPLTQGAGFVDAAGAVAMARFFANPLAGRPTSSAWGGRLIWGNQLLRGGQLQPNARAWRNDVVWGSAATISGQTIDWSGWDERRNVVWGSACGGADCDRSSTTATGSAYDESVVWGTHDSERVVWGTDSGDESVVWGTDCTDASCEPVVWGDP
jgi:serine protease AprX